MRIQMTKQNTKQMAHDAKQAGLENEPRIAARRLRELICGSLVLRCWNYRSAELSAMTVAPIASFFCRVIASTKNLHSQSGRRAITIPYRSAGAGTFWWRGGTQRVSQILVENSPWESERKKREKKRKKQADALCWRKDTANIPLTPTGASSSVPSSFHKCTPILPLASRDSFASVPLLPSLHWSNTDRFRFFRQQCQINPFQLNELWCLLGYIRHYFILP